MSRHANIKALIKELRDQDFIVEKTAQGHYRVCPPDPQYPIVHMGGDSGDPRAWKNNLSRLKKSGFIPSWEEPSSKRTPMEDVMQNGEGKPLDYLNEVLDLFTEVHGHDVSQILLERNEGGGWHARIPMHEHIQAPLTNQSGEGETPTEAIERSMSSMKGTIKDRIRKLQELEARLG